MTATIGTETARAATDGDQRLASRRAGRRDQRPDQEELNEQRDGIDREVDDDDHRHGGQRQGERSPTPGRVPRNWMRAQLGREYSGCGASRCSCSRARAEPVGADAGWDEFVCRLVRGWSILGRRSLRTSAALRDAADGGIEGVVLTHSHADHAEAADEFGVPVVLPADATPVGPVHRDRHAWPFCRTACASCSGGCASPGTRCSGRGASSSPPARARCPPTWTRCAACARWTSRPCARATARWSGTRRQSSTSTSRTASTANAGSSRRWRRAFAPKTSCLAAAWPEVPAALRPAAALTLAAHMEKLGSEGLLPPELQH